MLKKSDLCKPPTVLFGLSQPLYVTFVEQFDLRVNVEKIIN